MLYFSGFDRNGLDQEGYNRWGLDKSGYDREGYNLTGYSRQREYDGIIDYNKEGYDAEGYNRYVAIEHVLPHCLSVKKPSLYPNRNLSVDLYSIQSCSLPIMLEFN